MPTSADAPPNWSRLWAVVLAATFLSFFFANEADNDLWGHVLFGRDMLSQHALPRTDTYSYTATGAPWVNHEWLAQVLFAVAYGIGGGKWAVAPEGGARGRDLCVRLCADAPAHGDRLGVGSRRACC